MKQLQIALLGYGKMGKEIEKTALERNHSIIAFIDNEQDWQEKASLLAQADVAIDFSTPSAAPGNIERCFQHHLPIVVGTTGWDKTMPEIRERCLAESQSLFTASNFSIGVPSGTAITLAKNVMDCHSRYKDWQLAESPVPATQGGQEAGPCLGNAPIPCPAVPDGSLPIVSLREGETVGTHRLFFDSAIDTIELSHTAKSRQGFALGAVMAAEWLPGKTGCFGMQDLLGF